MYRESKTLTFKLAVTLLFVYLFSYFFYLHRPLVEIGIAVITGAALLENNEAATKLTTANGGTFT